MEKTRPYRRHGFESPCPVCRVVFYQHPSDHKTYCSTACKQVASRVHRRYMTTCQHCGQQFEAIEKPHSNNSNTYCSLKCRNFAYRLLTGIKNPNWKGGYRKNRAIKTGRIKYKEWRESVFKRDDFTCQRCGLRGIELNAHHILPWATNEQSRFDVKNGVTLCFGCHMAEHGRNFRVDLCQN